MKNKKDPPAKLPRNIYEKELKRLQIELCGLQSWVRDSGARIVILFEGRDAAGKGGAIKRIRERVSPRIFRVEALPKPSDRQKTQLYIQRYFERLPAAGEVVLFDRSWYNRAGVERVMGFCTDAEYKNFLEDTPGFERYLVREGITLIKYFFDVSREVQEKRFLARATDPRKHWKLSTMDLESYARWWEYTEAYERMIEATDTEDAPWFRVPADCKRRARLNCISHLLDTIPYDPFPFEAPDFPKPQRRRKNAPTQVNFRHTVSERY